MGEPVTEKMLVSIERESERAMRCGDSYPHDTVEALVAEVRRLRAREEQRRSFAHGNAALSNPLVTRAMIDEGAEKIDAENAYAAGYARAERDVVADIERHVGQIQERREQVNDWIADNACCQEMGALERQRKRIEQGAHRGAAGEGDNG